MYARRLKFMESLERKFAPLEKYHIDVVGLCEDTRGEIEFLKSKLERTDLLTSRKTKRNSKKGEGEQYDEEVDQGVDLQRHQPIQNKQGQPKERAIEGADGEREEENHNTLANGIGTQDHNLVGDINEQPKPEKTSNGNTNQNERSTLPTTRRRFSRPHPTTTTTADRTRKTILPSLFHRQEKDITPTRLILLSRTCAPPEPLTAPGSEPAPPCPVPTPETSRPRRRLSKAHQHQNRLSSRKEEKHVSWEQNDESANGMNEREGDVASKDVIPEEYWRDIGVAAATDEWLPVDRPEKNREKGKGKEKEKERESDTESLGSDITYSEGTEAGLWSRERMVRGREEGRRLEGEGNCG